jgi:hypothetical protein
MKVLWFCLTKSSPTSIFKINSSRNVWNFLSKYSQDRKEAVCRRVPNEFEHFGVKWVDDYAHLRQLTPSTRKYIDDENRLNLLINSFYYFLVAKIVDILGSMDLNSR